MTRKDYMKLMKKKVKTKDKTLIRSTLPVLKLLTKKGVDNKAVIKALKSRDVNRISRITRNIIHDKTLSKNSHLLKKLKRYKKTLRAMANAKTSIKRKKRLLLQKGGFLGALIPIIGKVLGKLLF